MSRFDCARCDWKPEGDEDRAEQLTAHAAEAEHFLCRVCLHSLPDHEATAVGCSACLNDARTLLAGIHALWVELPSHLGHVKGSGYDNDRPNAADGRPLPGGDVLVLLGPGGTGRSEDAQTWRANDCPSVAFTLTTLEDDLRHVRGDAASEMPPSSEGRVVGAAVRYLDTFMRWASVNHPAFDEIHADLKSLHYRLEAATGRSEIKTTAEAECFDCGGNLVRLWTDKGQDDHYTCARCRQTYDTARYTLALNAALRAALTWTTPRIAATVTGIPLTTIHGWATRDRKIRSDKAHDGSLLVWFPDVEEYASRRKAS